MSRPDGGPTRRVRAPAKLTLTLRVTGRRPDGYHDLDALAVSLSDPADDLEITPGAGPSRLEVTGILDGVPTTGDNLVVAAARLAGVSCHIRLHKRIPAGAGLGGGSADAAAVLRALGFRDPSLAARLGSDVPFCLHGGPARLRGRGEVLEPVTLPALPPVVVVHPGFPLATPSVYRAWDDLGGPAGTPVPAPAALAASGGELVNDLEPAAWHLAPRLADLARSLPRPGPARYLLAGSGSCLWAFATDRDVAAGTAAEVSAEAGLRCWVGEVLGAGGPGAAAGLSDPAGDAASASA